MLVVARRFSQNHGANSTINIYLLEKPIRNKCKTHLDFKGAKTVAFFDKMLYNIAEYVNIANKRGVLWQERENP